MRPAVFFRLRLRLSVQNTAELPNPDSLTHPGTKTGALSVVTDFLPVIHRYQREGGPFFVQTDCIYRHSSKTYVLRLPGVSFHAEGQSSAVGSMCPTKWKSNLNLPKFSLDHRAVVLAFVGVLLAVGLFNFTNMSRREDPQITIRDALVITLWPGASAKRVEELVTDPLEDTIAGIAEVDSITSKSMVGISIIEVTAEDQVTNVDQVWDEVRAKVVPVQQRNGQVTDVKPLAGLTSLERLWLENTQVSDVSPLAGLKNLEVLDLDGTQVSQKDYEILQKALPNYRIQWSQSVP